MLGKFGTSGRNLSQEPRHEHQCPEQRARVTRRKLGREVRKRG